MSNIFIAPDLAVVKNCESFVTYNSCVPRCRKTCFSWSYWINWIYDFYLPIFWLFAISHAKLFSGSNNINKDRWDKEEVSFQQFSFKILFAK